MKKSTAENFVIESRTMADDEATMAAMWGAQHRPDPTWLQQQGVNAANRAQTEVVVLESKNMEQQQQTEVALSMA